MKILSVITARGDSKKLPNKNILKFKKKPLIAHTIISSLKSNLITKTIVSTDSLRIANISRKYGAEIPFLRPKKLARDKSHSPDVVEHAVNFLEKKHNDYFDLILMLQPTSPLRTHKHLDAAIKKFLREKNQSLISISKQDFPPWWMFKISKKKLKSQFNWKNKNVFNMERQEFPCVYKPNGAIYITTRKNFKKSKNLVNTNSCGFYLMKEEESIDIDTALDFKIAESIKNNK